MPKELDIRALVESKMPAELVAIAEEEGVTFSPQGSKRDIAIEILEAREAAEAGLAELDAENAACAKALGGGPMTEPVTEIVIVDVGPVKVEAAPEEIAELEAQAAAILAEDDPKTEAGVEVDWAIYAVKTTSAAFLAAGQTDGPERKARREAKAKLYALLA